MGSPEKLWEPSPEGVRRTQMFTFMQSVARRRGIDGGWEALRRWSIDHAADFWQELVHFAEIEPSSNAEQVWVGRGMLDGRWFPGMSLNYARHMLRFAGDEAALLFESELGAERRISRDELRDGVARCAAALRLDGVKSGDRVAGYLPNLPETVIAMLATASLGAIWSSCSPDFGVGGVLDRFGQIEPVVLVFADGYTYGGKRFETFANVGRILEELPGVRRVVSVSYPDGERSTDATSLSHPASVGWTEYLDLGGTSPPDLQFEEVPFDHPLYIMYSSGTTGVPKCIVHGHGGTLLQHMKELMLHCDLRPGERIFYFTTCGWMMWNWLASSLGTGATVVLYEGNPGHPSLHHLWELASRTGVHVFGTSPKFLSACQKADLHPGGAHDLSALRCLLSTGSPLTVELFRWVYDRVKRDLQLSSISGGTDLISCFMLGNPLLPVYAGEIQCRGLAMDVHAWDTESHAVVGEKGELVCTSPFPSQPVEFWNDPRREKYRAAYFDVYPGVWRHGDFIEITSTGGVVVHGRSDATLNPGGVRIGTAEIYRIVEALPEVLDSIVVGKRGKDDVEIVLFVVLRGEERLTKDLDRRIRDAIATGATKRHVPRHIRQVTAIPHTVSGKKVEMAVHNILHGESVENRHALANPEALDEFAIDL